MTPDPDEILARMRADTESDWPARLLHDLAAAPLVEASDLRFSARRVDDTPLSPAEMKVVTALSHGLSYDEAAAALGLAVDTVKTHLQIARRKLRAKNTVHLCAIALRRTLIS